MTTVPIVQKEPKLASVHLIDDDGQLLPEAGISDFLISSLDDGKRKKCDDVGALLRSVGVNYHVVAVFGGQSSGKSTLLNHLFHTKFQTMDETLRRGQTTKGAFVARNPVSGTDSPAEESPLYVLDFEGTDGIERGEDQSFERQLSLFALSVADTLIINMWAVDVGRFNAANMSLLRTIFEVNLQLFSHDSYEREEKPTLLIVLRDFTDEDPSHHIRTVRDSFDKIWTSIAKPETFAESSIDALFELRYRCLPHYKLQRPAFESSITEFRSWFLSPISKDYLFADREAMFRGVPLDGLSAYLTNCWDMIRHSKDLDIPTQREMLARHRCQEIRHALMEHFALTCRAYASRLHRGDLVPQLSSLLDSDIDAELKEFQTQTRLYAQAAVKEAAAELEGDLISAQLQLLSQYAKTIASVVVAALDTSVSGAVDAAVRWVVKESQNLPLIPSWRGGGNATGDYRDVNHTDTSNSSAPSMYNTSYNSTSYNGSSGGVGSSNTSTGPNSSAALVPDSEKCCALISAFWSRLGDALQSIIHALSPLNEVPLQHLQQQQLYGRFAELVEKDAALRSCVAHAAVEAIYQKVRHRFAAMAESAPETVHHAFEQALTRTADGTVRFFTTTKGLQAAEPLARQAGLVLLGCLLYYRLGLVRVEGQIGREDAKPLNGRAASRLGREEWRLCVRANEAERHFFLEFVSLIDAPNYPLRVPIRAAEAEGTEETEAAVVEDCVLLSQQAVQRAFDLYTQKSEFTVQLQLRTIESGKQSLPAWVLPALLLLGWNELWYVLTSPVLLIVIILITALFFKQFIFAQWQAFEETGPTWLVLTIRTVMQKAQTLHASALHYTGGTADGMAVGNAAEGAQWERHADPMSNWTGATAKASDPLLPSSNMRRRHPQREDSRE